MEDKQKQIEEMASKLNELFIPYIGHTNDFMRLEIAQELLKHYQPRLPEVETEQHSKELQNER